MLAGTLGFKMSLFSVKGVLVLLHINLCAGEVSNPSEGVLRHSNKASRGSSPQSCERLRIVLAAFTADSAFPFDYWW